MVNNTLVSTYHCSQKMECFKKHFIKQVFSVKLQLMHVIVNNRVYPHTVCLAMIKL